MRSTAAITASGAAQLGMERRGADERAKILEKAAHLFEAIAAISSRSRSAKPARRFPTAWRVREAVDYLRDYAQRARADFGTPLKLRRPTGESNELRLEGRGLFGCISPGIPARHLTGQVSAALAGRQCRARQAGRVDAADCASSDQPAARSRGAA